MNATHAVTQAVEVWDYPQPFDTVASDDMRWMGDEVRHQKYRYDPRCVCACYSVGLEAIRRAVAEGGAANVADIGRTLRAGANCGSCVPELQGIIKRTASAVGSRTAS